MIIRILGSAAGGGFPQINCACRMCAGAREGKVGFIPRTQTSVAVSADGRTWIILNVSPDLRQQVAQTPALAPARNGGSRSSPVTAVALTNGDVDAIAGLLSLREGIDFDLYAAEPVLETLASNSVFNVLHARSVKRRLLPTDQRVDVTAGLSLEAFAVPGKTALYLERDAPNFGSREAETIGLAIRDTKSGTCFYFIPSCAAVTEALAARLQGAPLVLFDGTLYTDDEMIRLGLSQKTGQRMGHMSMSGTSGSIAALSGLAIKRRVYLHINNSNPVLDDTGPERRAVEAAGWEVAYDGMEIAL